MQIYEKNTSVPNFFILQGLQIVNNLVYLQRNYIIAIAYVLYD